ncbi:acyltransferase [Lacticaseibacillus porcinae]|uniref:acyltransferase n=1 Tax=Lacticaseibacillus porcinae TaxID=1123687 RepID=UPI000F768AB1|nr:acyltransferase [Lacticaseibacillus porcinae]
MARRYLHEVDFMRAFFICGVLWNHTINQFTSLMAHHWHTPYYALRSIRMIGHFSRMGFMFMTGLVLMMIYYEKHDWPTFWKKRYNGVLWPYLIWNSLLLAVMIGVNQGNYSWLQLPKILLHGDHFYMYYLLITMQLYLLFPVIVKLFHRFERHQLRLVIISFIIQLSLVTLIKYGLWGVNTNNWPYWFKAYSINVFVYQFYVVLGGYVALHRKKVVNWLNQIWGLLVPFTISLGLGTVIYYRGFNQQLLALRNSHALSPHQPYMLVYDTAMILMTYGLGQRFASWRLTHRKHWIAKFIHNIATVSFGMYLNQTLALMGVKWVLSQTGWSSLQLVWVLPIGYVAVVSMSFAMAWFCYRFVPFGLLIGRPRWHLRLKTSKPQIVENADR